MTDWYGVGMFTMLIHCRSDSVCFILSAHFTLFTFGDRLYGRVYSYDIYPTTLPASADLRDHSYIHLLESVPTLHGFCFLIIK